MTYWYVIKTKPKQEKAVFGQLSKAGYEIFLPQIEGVHAPKPLFPSYLFISARLENAEEYRLVKYTRGVNCVLGDSEGPSPISTLVVDELKCRTRDGQIVSPELLFQAGDTVRVRRGLLKDLIGMIERHYPEEKRVQILFKWWSTSMRAKLRYSDLEAA